MNLLPALTNDGFQAQSVLTGACVLVRHPGYSDAYRSNVLLELSAVDRHAEINGIQAALVHTACAIIAANRWDGWLSTSKDPSSARIDHLRTQVLEAGSYYFHVPLDSQRPSNVITQTPYPVVPNFAEWSFPDGNLPDIWTRPAIAPEPSLDTNTRARDTSCRITQCVDITEEAHIVPKSEVEWFAMNGMGLYNRSSSRHGQDRIDGSQNRILLRQDIHTAWDRMYFSIVPKPSTALAQQICTVAAPTTTAMQQPDIPHSDWYWTYHLHAGRGQLHATFHNHVLHSLRGISREYLFARFAWTMFPMIHHFLQSGVPRWVSLRRRSDEEAEVRLAAGTECKFFCENQGRFRSASPRKKSGSPSKRQRSSDDQSMMQVRRKRRWHYQNKQRMSFTDTDSETNPDGDESSTYDQTNSFATRATSDEDLIQHESTVSGDNEFSDHIGGHEEEDPCGFRRRQRVYEEEGEGGDHWSLKPASSEESRGRVRQR